MHKTRPVFHWPCLFVSRILLYRYQNPYVPIPDGMKRYFTSCPSKRQYVCCFFLLIVSYDHVIGKQYVSIQDRKKN